MNLTGWSDLPANVPPGLVRDVDVYGFETEGGDLQAAMLALRQTGMPELFWTPRNGGHWVVTRAADIGQVIADPGHFSNRYNSVPKTANPRIPLLPIQADPPRLDALRLLLAPAFAPRALRELSDRARGLAVELIEELQPRGRCEFIGDFANVIPSAVFLWIVGVPASDRPHLLTLTEPIARPRRIEDRMAALEAATQYVRDLIAERRARPGEDLISRIVGSQIEGQPLAEEELVGLIMLLMLAGLDTVASMMGFFAHYLATAPVDRRLLARDPAQIPAAVEELLRRYGIIVLSREVRQQLELHGVTLQVGDMIVAPTMLDGLDEAKFPDPLRVDFTRPKPAHVTFGGQSAHRCLGAMLARSELQIFMEEWLKRIPEFNLSPGQAPHFRGRSTANIDRVCLEWKP